LPAFQPDVDSANAETDQIGTTTGDYQDSVQLSGLSASTRYCYEVFSSTAVNLLGTGVSQTFSTLDATTSTTPLNFDVVGDLGETTGIDESADGINEDQAAIDDEIGQSGAKFVLLAGDVGYSGGTDTNYGDLTSTGSEVSDIFGSAYWPQTGGIPVFSADGNHGQNITGLRTFPEEQTAKNSGGAGGTYAYGSYVDPTEDVNTSSPDAWYAFSDGGVRIYVLDAAWQDSTAYLATTEATGSLCGAVGSTQAGYCQGYELDAAEHWQQTSGEYQWLKADLAAHPGGIKMAVFHYPLQSDNATQPSDPYLQQDLEPMLAASGVQIAFNGHAHTYQRFTPNPGSTNIISYVTGGGGGTLEPVQGGSTCAAMEANQQVYALGYDSAGGSSCGQTAPAGSSLVAAEVYNFLNVTVDNGAVTVSPENALGQTFDSQTYQFTTTPPPSTTTTTTKPGSPPTTTTTLASSPPSPPSSPTPVSTACMAHLPAGTVVGTAALPDGSGYYEVDSAGDVAAFGAAKCYGAMTGTPLSRPMVGMAVDPATGGYWLVATDGGIFSFNAPFLGSTGAIHLNQPVVGMTASPDGRGYWFVASDGGIFSFGDAAFYGSTGSIHLNQPVVGMAAAPSGHGYWLVASDGGIFSFGSAGFFGSTGSMHLNRPIVSLEATGDGHGYRLIASDGGVFDFGSAPFYGSAGSIRLNRPMIGGAGDNATGGYWLMASDGGVFAYGAPFMGSAA
jgi:hypothetical protein